MNLFWNAAEHRLRAGWRVLVQTAIIAVLTVGGRLILDTTVGGRELATRVFAHTSATLLVTALSLWLGGRLLDRRRFADFGLHLDRAWWADFSAGLLLGSLLMALIFGVEWCAGWLVVTCIFAAGTLPMPFALTILLLLLYYTGIGINEEILTRGYGVRNLAEGLSTPRIGEPRAIVLAWLLSSCRVRSAAPGECQHYAGKHR
jgi:hypothetical protein